MELAILQSEIKTMSSREIATLCEKDHGHVCRDIETMFEQISMPTSGYIHFWRHPQNGQQYREFKLDKDLTLTLVSGYSAALRYRIIQRWQALESQQPKELTRMDLIQLAYEAEQERLALEHKVNELQPKADAHDLLSASKGSFNIRVAAGELDVPERKFTKWLEDNNWMYRNEQKILIPFAKRKEQGYLELIVKTTYNTGEPINRCQTMITSKGMARLAQIFSKNRALLSNCKEVA